jgi:hypothetical protein
MDNRVTFVRLERVKTGSWMTYEFPYPMDFIEGEEFLKVQLPGWEIASGCDEDPDYVDRDPDNVVNGNPHDYLRDS